MLAVFSAMNDVGGSSAECLLLWHHWGHSLLCYFVTSNSYLMQPRVQCDDSPLVYLSSVDYYPSFQVIETMAVGDQTVTVENS